MSDNSMLISLKDILEGCSSIYIPSYQRGYRWTQEEVKQLLQDIWDFNGEHYFLQLLAVNKCIQCKRMRVVDGQQRLTTVILILKELCSKEDAEKLPSLAYECRGINGGEIDEYYRKQAQETIKEFLKNKNEEDKDRFKKKVLNCQFIYFDRINSEAEERALFHRRNTWIMPMRDSEDSGDAADGEKDVSQKGELDTGFDTDLSM